MKKHLHVIAFDVPYPVDYGGVMDVYYRLKGLKANGVSITLHCYTYGRREAPELLEVADKVYYYKRELRLVDQLSILPFIVKSRWNNILYKRLMQDDSPILMEGHHSSFCLLDSRFKERKMYVRVHNVEQDYYAALGKRAAFFKGLYYKTESWKLKRYEAYLKRATAVFCLSKPDLEHYSKIHPCVHLWEVGVDVVVPTFTGEEKKQVLYHGNLSVSENEEVVNWLLQAWASKQIALPLLIAGKNPSKQLQLKIAAQQQVSLLENPSTEDLDLEIQASQYTLAMSNQRTGVKLKLIKNLLLSRCCLANPTVLYGTDLASYVEVFNNANELTNILGKTNVLVLTKDQHQAIAKRFDPIVNAQAVSNYIFGADEQEAC